MTEPSETPGIVNPGEFVLWRTRPALLLFVALYAATIYLPFLGSSRTLTSHEVMITHPAMRILEDGHWIVPRYASGRWLDKPPLLNWVTALGFATLGGFSEFAARLPSALSAIGLCVLMAWATDRLVGRRAAVFAGLVQATCVYMLIQGRLGEIDMPFTLLMTAAHVVLLLRWARGDIDLPLGAGLVFHLLAALAVLAKGALAVVLLGMTVLAFCAIRRSWRPLRAVVFTPGIGVFLLIAGGWHVAAWFEAGQEALDQWRYNSVLRFLGLHHLGTAPFYFYFYTIPWLMLPWSVALILGVRRLWQDARRPHMLLDQFLWSWFLGGLVFFTLCFFKQKHYILPLLPPLTVFCARLLDLHLTRDGVRARRFFVITFAVIPLVFGAVSGVILPSRDHRQETVAFLRQAMTQIPPKQELFVIGLGQSSAYPYITHEPCIYFDTLEDVRETLHARHGEDMWILTLRQYQSLGDEAHLTFEEALGEREREHHPRDETIVLGRLTLGSPASAPASGQP